MNEFRNLKGMPLESEEAALDLESFPLLLEAVNRLILRRNHLNDAIRLLDIATYYHAVKQPLPHAPRWILDPITQKLGADILDLFIHSNGLSSEFLEPFNFPTSPPQQGPQQPATDMANALGNGPEKDRSVQLPLLEVPSESTNPNDEGASPQVTPDEPTTS